MKKSRIIEVAAVASLLIAPATTTFFATNNAQASLISDIFSNPSDTNEQISKVTAAVNGLQDQTYNESNPMPNTAEFQGVAGLSENGRGLSPVSFSSEIVSINSGMDDAAISAMANTKVQGLKIYVTGSNLKTAISNAYNKGNGSSFSFTVTLKNGDNTLATKKLTYTNNTQTNNGGSVTTTPSNGLTNITKLSGYNTVTLAGPSGFVYSLFSAEGKKSNRGLAGETAWYTDETAQDANGNTYYRVSTDEWVQYTDNVTLATK